MAYTEAETNTSIHKNIKLKIKKKVNNLVKRLFLSSISIYFT